MGDPMDRLAAVMDEIEVTTRDAACKLRRNERNRIGLLIVHACAALAIGLVLAASGRTSMIGPGFVILREIPGWPYTLGLLLAAGGAILLPAALLRVRRWEQVGLWVICGWYALMAGGFAGAVCQWVLAGLPAHGRPALYPALVYLHLAVIMRVHLWTLQRMNRAEC